MKIKTLDIGSSLEQGQFDIKKPEFHIQSLVENGINRIVLPGHGVETTNERKDDLANWVEVSKSFDFQTLLYTGPFGTEFNSTVTDKAKHWIQKDYQGNNMTYDSGGHMPMFCPASPYLRNRRLPIIINLLQHTGADGIFWDIPWILGKHGSGGCHCEYCYFIEQEGELTKQENMVYKAMKKGNNLLKDIFPDIHIAANASAPAIWDPSERGGTHKAMGQIVDELVTEWTPGEYKGSLESGFYKSITKSIEICSTKNYNISHAYSPSHMTKDNAKVLARKILEAGAGLWTNDPIVPFWK